MTRIGIFGWGIVAPHSPDVATFETNLERSESWLSPFEGFGPCNFLVGHPELDFERYRPWIDARFPPARFPQIVDKMDRTSLHAIAAFIQALGQNPGIEGELQALGLAAHVYVGCGLGNLPTIAGCSVALWKAQRRWDRFWADPSRHPELCRYREGDRVVRAAHADAPEDPGAGAPFESETAEAWDRYWAGSSPLLREYLADLKVAESVDVVGDVESGKLNAIRLKQQRFAKLQARWESPEPPWRAVSPNILWNISNTPSAQISMIGRITGLAFAPVGACSTFGVTLKLAIDSIRRGEAKAVVIGATDPPPHPLTVGAFYSARVISADAGVSKPLAGLRGTHVSGGAAIWIVGDYDHFVARGYKPLGMEPIAVGVSSDAHHIITPSKDGPHAAIQQALGLANTSPGSVATWDLHATATPGDFLEVQNMRDILPETVLVTARKGTFGHGMSACGGWELTAQYLGIARRRLFPTALRREELNAQIAGVHRNFVFDQDAALPKGIAGKLSMGVGGVNACVLSRPFSA